MSRDSELRKESSDLSRAPESPQLGAESATLQAVESAESFVAENSTGVNQNLLAKSRSGKSQGLRTILLLTLILALPIIPFLLLGDRFESWLEQQLQQTTSPQQFAWIAAGLLAVDIAVPVPSSAVATLMGAKLGIVWATLVGALGASLGAVVGYEAARWMGPRWALRWSSLEELARAQRWIDRYGVLVLVVARGLPIVGEATVLALGLYGMPRTRFLPALFLTNAALIAVYASLGSWAAEQGWLPVAVGLATALPLIPLLALGKRKPAAPNPVE